MAIDQKREALDDIPEWAHPGKQCLTWGGYGYSSGYEWVNIQRVTATQIVAQDENGHEVRYSRDKLNERGGKRGELRNPNETAGLHWRARQQVADADSKARSLAKDKKTRSAQEVAEHLEELADLYVVAARRARILAELDVPKP